MVNINMGKTYTGYKMRDLENFACIRLSTIFCFSPIYIVVGEFFLAFFTAASAGVLDRDVVRAVEELLGLEGLVV